ncbi:hypothetical protein PHYPSEUDO_008239 [Phytophthora pseudosyringae]|uniref:Phosphoribosyltransferase domain-containing protein n=1 Tax=Phytophthora pseudosyringae TaxID=221518 RepID=A0A8T1VF01_9STRA|nr:hypothetical protein PHYPSEUDO_008239 [Phytophthora pseudosyringae]
MDVASFLNERGGRHARVDHEVRDEASAGVGSASAATAPGESGRGKPLLNAPAGRSVNSMRDATEQGRVSPKTEPVSTQEDGDGERSSTSLTLVFRASRLRRQRSQGADLRLVAMKQSPTALPELSSYLPTSSSDSRTSIMAITSIDSSVGVKKRRNSVEGAFSALSPSPSTPHQLENEQLKRKQAPLEVEDRAAPAVSFSRLDSIYRAQEHGSPLVISKDFAFSSTSSSHDGDVESTSYFASQPTTPRRERTSRYLSEGDRREIITRIDAGEKQVALAREFSVSRAAICNLYKNRWEVLTRGGRNPESKHPKSTKSRGKRSSPRSTLRPAANDEASTGVAEPITVYPDVSMISINAEESRCDNNQGSNTDGIIVNRSRKDEDDFSRDSSLSSVALQLDSMQGDHLGHHHEIGHHQASPDQRSPFDEVGSSPVVSPSFLVHEASAYSYPCRNLIASLRDESISTVVFQQRATRLARLLIEEALTCLPHEDLQIKNQFGDVCHATQSLHERDVCGISMEDKSMVLLRAFSTISPSSPTGVVSIETRATDYKSNGNASIHAQLPPVSSHQVVLLLDIQCATGNEACAVLHHLVHERQIPAKRIYFVTVISSFEGLQNVFRHFPVVTLITAQVDTVLDMNQRIRPGIGDFMQRYWNVHADRSAS